MIAIVLQETTIVIQLTSIPVIVTGVVLCVVDDQEGKSRNCAELEADCFQHRRLRSQVSFSNHAVLLDP